MKDWAVKPEELIGLFNRVAPPIDAEEIKGILRVQRESIATLEARGVDTATIKDMCNMAMAALFQVHLLEKELAKILEDGVSQEKTSYDLCLHAISCFAVTSALAICDSMIERAATASDAQDAQNATKH